MTLQPIQSSHFSNSSIVFSRTQALFPPEQGDVAHFGQAAAQSSYPVAAKTNLIQKLFLQYLFARQGGYQPQHGLAWPDVIQAFPPDPNIQRAVTCRFKSRTGIPGQSVQLPGLLLSSAQKPPFLMSGYRPTILFVHGNWGIVPQNKTSGAHTKLIHELLARGFNVFVFNLQGFEHSGKQTALPGTAPTEEGLYESVAAACRCLHSQAIPKESIIVLGHSLGGAAATGGLYKLNHESPESAPQALVLLSSFSRMKSQALEEVQKTAQKGGLISKLLLPFKKALVQLCMPKHFYDSAQFLSQLQNLKTGILILTNQNDQKIKSYHSRLLAQSLPQSVKHQCVVYPDSGHDPSPQSVINSLIQFYG